MLKAVVGLQFGDEGKGKFVDYLSRTSRHIVRFNGGANAGHSVQRGKHRAFFSQLPATMDEKDLYITQGALTSPDILINELNFLKKVGLNSTIHIDPRSHVVLPLHVELNAASEHYKGKNKIGSVGKGIGACFEDKSNRLGLRLADLVDKNVLSSKLEFLWKIRERQIEQVFSGKLSIEFEDVLHTCHQHGLFLEKYFSFTNERINEVLQNGETVLLETSQATFLDNAFGTYPYTVAYQTLVQSCFPLIGIPAREIDSLGVMKAYMIRVGNGPFPTEIHTELADYIREAGNEYGTVSKRPRRCGWLDLNLIKHATKLNGIKELAITNVDVLGGLDSIQACIGYESQAHAICTNRALMQLEHAKPIYKEFAGWEKITGSHYSYNDLPEQLKSYLAYIEDYVGVPIKFISYGPDRDQTIQVF